MENLANSYSRAAQIADCAVAPSMPFNLTMMIRGVAFDVSPVDMMDRLPEPHARLCQVSLSVNDWRKALLPGGDVLAPYQFPAPAIYVGNNWLRNFLVSYTLTRAPSRSSRSSSSSSMTVGCDAPGLRGRCAPVPSSPPTGSSASTIA